MLLGVQDRSARKDDAVAIRAALLTRAPNLYAADNLGAQLVGMYAVRAEAGDYYEFFCRVCRVFYN